MAAVAVAVQTALGTGLAPLQLLMLAGSFCRGRPLLAAGSCWRRTRTPTGCRQARLCSKLSMADDTQLLRCWSCAMSSLLQISAVWVRWVPAAHCHYLTALSQSGLIQQLRSVPRLTSQWLRAGAIVLATLQRLGAADVRPYFIPKVGTPDICKTTTTQPL